ncbi:MAG: ABC transporter permease [Desulfobacterales bacterium]|nr:ABC transporter permease [Desulfobacterales bacterium]
MADLRAVPEGRQAFKLRTIFSLVSVASRHRIDPGHRRGHGGGIQEGPRDRRPLRPRLTHDLQRRRRSAGPSASVTRPSPSMTWSRPRQSFSSAYIVVPMTSVSGITVSYLDRKYQTRVIGSTNDYSRAWTWPVVTGSDFTEDDVKGLRNVALIGQYLQQELFGGGDPIGKYMLVKGIPVQIVGVLQERGTSPSGDNLDDRIVMPLTTVMRKLQNESTYVSAFRMRFTDQENLYNRVEELRTFLRRRHRLGQGQPDDFRIVSPREIVTFLVALTGSLVIFLGIAGIISLVVAGFVLANLFLLSVRERTNEIGIRRATGAKKRDILYQFLSESVIITTHGGTRFCDGPRGVEAPHGRCRFPDLLLLEGFRRRPPPVLGRRDRLRAAARFQGGKPETDRGDQGMKSRTFLNLAIAVRSLYNFKMRTALAVLGVFLGTFSLVVVSNVSESLSVQNKTGNRQPGRKPSDRPERHRRGGSARARGS